MLLFSKIINWKVQSKKEKTIKNIIKLFLKNGKFFLKNEIWPICIRLEQAQIEGRPAVQVDPNPAYVAHHDLAHIKDGPGRPILTPLFILCNDLTSSYITHSH